MKHSYAKKLSLVFSLVSILVLLAIGACHYFLIDDFYMRDKQKILVESYERVKGKESNYGTENFENFCSVNSLLYCVADAESLTVIATNAKNDNAMTGRLLGNLLGQEDENSVVISQQDNYRMIEIHDRFTNMDYLELWGNIENGNYYIVLVPLQSISDAANISFHFYIIIGLFAIALGCLIIFFMSRRMVQPIKKLTEYSKKMANLDFDVHYDGREEDEIGELGQNFNLMSEHLERAISDLKSANAKLEKDIAEKTEIDEMRKEFLSNVSHELKTPIAIIQGYGEGLQDMIGEDDDISRHYADIIVDESQKMNNMVKKLLTLNHLEFGNEPLQMDRFDLAELIRGIVQTQKVMIEKKGADVVFQPDGPKPVYVWGDEFKIEEVVTNYMTNALNHLENGNLIEITCTEEDGIVTTTVFNKGKPIPEDSLDKVWIKFYKVDKARTRAYGGSGIGLSIVKAIMDAHRQKCWCTNYKDGVAFSFTLESKV